LNAGHGSERKGRVYGDGDVVDAVGVAVQQGVFSRGGGRVSSGRFRGASQRGTVSRGLLQALLVTQVADIDGEPGAAQKYNEPKGGSYQSLPRLSLTTFHDRFSIARVWRVQLELGFIARFSTD